MRVRIPQDFDRYLVKKGSIAIDGMSLTIAMLEEARINHGPIVGVTIIPHTYANTTLGSAELGAHFNVEVDILAKHLEKLLASR
jgi:riboflavin synthase